MLLAQGTEEGADVPARCSGSSIADSARGRSRSGRRARGQHRLEDASPVERSGQLGGVVLHTPYGVEPEALADERRGGGSNTEQSLSTLIRVCSLLLISQESLEEPLEAFGSCGSILLSLGFSRVEGRMCDLGTSVRKRSSTEA